MVENSVNGMLISWIGSDSRLMLRLHDRIRPRGEARCTAVELSLKWQHGCLELEVRAGGIGVRVEGGIGVSKQDKGAAVSRRW